MEEDLPVDLIVDWLRTQVTGCFFARTFATERDPAKIRFTTVRGSFNDGVGSTLHEVLLQAAAEKAAMMFVFPAIREDEEVYDLLTALAEVDSFRISEKPWPEGANRQDILVKVEWQTPTGHISKALGLAPSGIMPVTRRAPFVCLFVWPGGHDNAFRPDNYATVGVVDMKFDMPRAIYDGLWQRSVEEKARRDAEEPSVSASFRDVAFCLHRRVRPQFRFSLSNS